MRQDFNYNFIEKLENLPYVKEIWLFGSRARGDHRERSDIDIAIVCPQSTDREWNHIMDIIENADTLLKIDCVRLDKNTISEDLLNNILKDGRVIYVQK